MQLLLAMYVAAMKVFFYYCCRYGNYGNGALVVQGCFGTEAKLYDCWYYSVDLGLCSIDVAVECKGKIIPNI